MATGNVVYQARHLARKPLLRDKRVLRATDIGVTRGVMAMRQGVCKPGDVPAWELGWLLSEVCMSIS